MTEILPPLKTLVHEDKIDENISFKVLNQDNLPMTISEERIFKPFDSESQKRKPNGIVYPTRRIDLGNQQLNQQKHLAKSNGHLEGHFKLNTNDMNFSASHGNLYKIPKQKSPDDFAKHLDAKLRKLQIDKKRTDPNHLKKPFITTVKKGVFLEPPEISPPVSKTSRTEDELFEETKDSRKQLYAYVSKPMVLNRSPPQNVHRSRCEAAACAAGLQYDRDSSTEETRNAHKHRAKRDTTLEDSKPRDKSVNKERGSYIVQANHKIEAEDLQKKETRENMARRRALARKKAKIQSSRTGHVTGSIHVPPRNTKLKAVEIQTENYLFASLVKPPIIDMDTQTELELLSGMSIYRNETLRESHDEETQIIPGDLYNLEGEIQGALDILVGQTIESALIEILEEEELAALKEQQRRFFEMRAEEQKEAGDLMERHLIEQMSEKNKGGASVLLEKYLLQLIPSVIDQLRSAGVISEEEYFKNGSFLPWLIEEVTMELVDILSSGDVLLEMVQDIINRKTEISNVMNIPAEHEAQDRKEIEQIIDDE